MGIQSTQDITRDQAIYRIVQVSNLIKTKNYIELEQTSFEPDINLQEFVDNWDGKDTTYINNWTDKMIEDIMDEPFFRYSMFENYLIRGN